MMANILLILLSFLPCVDGNKYPVPPKSANHLFYIQRSLNTNTIIYEAQFDAQGNLNTENPVKAYWIDYEEGGKISDLTTLEKRFAYGIKHKQLDKAGQNFKIELAAYSELSLRLKSNTPYNAAVSVITNNTELPLHHVFVTANDKGIFTTVKSIKVFLHQQNSETLIEKEIYKK